MSLVLMLVVFGLIFYFMILCPQQKRTKEHKKLTDSIVKGDGVLTSGGLVGRVTRVTGNGCTAIVLNDTTEVVIKCDFVTVVPPEGTMKVLWLEFSPKGIAVLNHYPLWKYIMLTMVIVVGPLYALPNLFDEDPAVQITGAHGVTTSEQMLIQVQKTSQEERITAKFVTLEEDATLARSDSVSTQLRTHEALMSVMGDKYVVVLNLTPATLRWPVAIHAESMKLGLGLRDGVHFLIEVGMDTVLGKFQEQNTDSLRSNLHEKDIPYTTVRKESNYGLSITFRNVRTRDEVIVHLSRRHPGLVISNRGNNQLHVVVSDACLSETREYMMQQNINILRNRINQFGVAEPVVQHQGTNRIVAKLPGIQDTAHVKETLSAMATLEFRLVNANVDQAAAASGRVPGGSEMK